jgi:hypothetical protein
MKKIYKIFSFLLIALATFQNLEAQVIFSESFNYPVGNLQGNNGGTGFSTMWDQANTDVAATLGNVDNAKIVTGNINPLSAGGTKLQVCLQSGKSARFDRSITTPTLTDATDGQNFWLGFWYSSSSVADANAYGIAAQFILMNSPNTTTVTDQRLGFGKTSNFTTTGNVANTITAFTRASSGGCAAQNWPATATAAIPLNLPSNGTYYILVKISKKEFPLFNIGSVATPNLQDLDGVRVWVLTAPPSGDTDPIFTTKPLGDFKTTDANTGLEVPIQTRLLRNTGNVANTTCRKDGINGVRIRVEGTSTNAFCAEFDDIKMGVNLVNDILPIHLENFQAKQLGKENILQWATLTESNNRGFHIEQSKNGLQWQTIGFVRANGNSTQKINYNFTDNNPFELTYYRLRQEDLDGKISFSKTAIVKRSENVSIEVFPNPANAYLQINLNKASNNNTATVIDLQGRKLINQTFNGYSNHLNITTLSKGMYLLNITTENGNSFVKFIKN